MGYDYWESGNDPCSNICNKIANTRDVLFEWSQARFGDIKKDIERTRAQLATFFDSSFSALADEVRLGLEAKLNDLLMKEQTF